MNSEMLRPVRTFHYNSSVLGTINLLEFVYNLFHIWPRSRIYVHTAFRDLSKPALVHHTGYLHLTLLGIWQLPDAHLTEENTKTVDIDLIYNKTFRSLLVKLENVVALTLR